MSLKLLQEEVDFLFHHHQVLELVLTQKATLPGTFSRIVSTLMRPLLHQSAPHVMARTLLRKVKVIVCTTLAAYSLELVEVEVLSENISDELSISYH
jgi:hypothetical protein